jgi:hypothetical protein
LSTFKLKIKNSFTKGKGVFAQSNFVPGTLVISSQVEKIVPQRNRYSLECNGQHIIMDEPALFINHSCEPNCQPVPNEHGAYDFLALKYIQNGD